MIPHFAAHRINRLFTFCLHGKFQTQLEKRLQKSSGNGKSRRRAEAVIFLRSMQSNPVGNHMFASYPLTSAQLSTHVLHYIQRRNKRLHALRRENQKQSSLFNRNDCLIFYKLIADSNWKGYRKFCIFKRIF